MIEYLHHDNNRQIGHTIWPIECRKLSEIALATYQSVLYSREGILLKLVITMVSMSSTCLSIDEDCETKYSWRVHPGSGSI